MGIVLYKVDDCCGDIETKIVDPFEVEKAGPCWYLSKEEAIDNHDSEFFINLEFATIRCLIKKLKAVMLENKKLRNEIAHLEDKIDSAYVSFAENDGFHT
jgi:hypothetical protein